MPRGGDRRSGPPVKRGAKRPPRRESGLGGDRVEGRQAVREALIAGRRRIHQILLANDLEPNDVVTDICDLARDRGVPVRRVSRSILEREARSESPQGVVATAEAIPEADLARLLRPSDSTTPFLVAVDGVTDPGNLGAILRSCDGAGVTGVLLPKHRAVHVTPTVAKASAGAVEHVPMAIVSGLPTALRQAKDAGIWVVGLHDQATKSLFDMGDLAREPICLVLGAEGAGLSRLVRERCDETYSIPMRGAISSLNVGAAAALATYEVVRRRARGVDG